MALTLTEIRKGVVGDLRYSIQDVAFDSSYPTGGEDITPADVGLGTILMAEGNDVDTPGIVANFDPAASKMMLAVAGAQPSNASDQSAVVARVLFLGY